MFTLNVAEVDRKRRRRTHRQCLCSIKIMANLCLSIMSRPVLVASYPNQQMSPSLSKLQHQAPLITLTLNATTEVGSKALTAITRHLLDFPSCLKVVLSKFPHCFKVLSKARNLQHLKTLEAMYIKLRKPNLCVQKEYVIKLCLV